MKKINKEHKNEIKNGARIIDLTSYISPDQILSDVDGSYTGITADTFYNGEYEEPVQDADDL